MKNSYITHGGFIKGALCSSGEEIQTQDFDIYYINEVIIFKHKYLYFSAVLRGKHCLELRRWQGPPNVNKVNQYEIVLCFKKKKTLCEFSFLLIKMSSPKLHGAQSC